MIVYGDLLFLLNLLLDYCLLLTTAKIAGVAFVRLRLLLAALFGACYALTAFLPGLIFLAKLPIRLVMGGAMVLIAFGWHPNLGRLALVFGSTAAALGGGVLALTNVGGATVHQGFATTSSDLVAVALAGSLGCAGMSVLFRRKGRTARYAQVSARLQDYRVDFRALVDTGNHLRDREDHRVVICDYTTLACLLPGFCREDAHNPALGFERWSGRLGPSRLTLLSYSTVGVGEGLLLAIRPEQISLDGKRCNGMLLAASPNPVSSDGSYQGLVGIE